MEDYSKYRSGMLTNGLNRSGQRALLYSLGMEENDFRKPLIAVVGSFTEIVPGHIHIRELAQFVKQGVLEGGGVPREFDTIAICDGLCQGHEGMRYPLPSREVIADSIEMMIGSHHFDGMVMLPGCDKIVPGMLMAAARVDIPAIVVPSGAMLGGKYDGNQITLSDVREYVGRVQTGKMSLEDLLVLEQEALPTYGTCSMLGTANSMGYLCEILGMSLPHASSSIAVSTAKRRSCKASGRRIVEMVEEDLTARKILTREAILDGISASMAMGCSTNTVLHLMAIAMEAHVDIKLSDFDEISRKVPYLCNFKPAGKYPVGTIYEHGGVYAVLKSISSFLHEGHMTVTGKTLLENLENVKLVENDVIYPLSAPKNKEGGIAILYGNLAPDGAVIKQSGVDPSMITFKGIARVFESMEDCCDALSAGEIADGSVIVIRYEGPKGGPGMREMFMCTSILVGRGMDTTCALITDGRFSGSTRGPCIGHISPEAAAGGPIALIEEGDEISMDIPNRTLVLHVSDEVLAARRAVWTPVKKPTTPALAKYSALVTSADKGAVIQIPE